MQKKKSLMHHAHSPAFFFVKGQGPLGERGDARRRPDARRLVDAEQPWLRHLEGLEEPGTRFRARQAHDQRQMGDRVLRTPPGPHRQHRRPTRPGSPMCKADDPLA